MFGKLSPLIFALLIFSPPLQARKPVAIACSSTTLIPGFSVDISRASEPYKEYKFELDRYRLNGKVSGLYDCPQPFFNGAALLKMYKRGGKYLFQKEYMRGCVANFEVNLAHKIGYLWVKELKHGHISKRARAACTAEQEDALK